MSEWQPISTAPRDGTYILVARVGEDIGVAPIEIVEWCSMERFHWENVEGDLYRKVFDAPEELWNGNGHRATHWMPLPPPPTNPADSSSKLVAEPTAAHWRRAIAKICAVGQYEEFVEKVLIDASRAIERKALELAREESNDR